jgi:hypothetical protein
MSKQRLEARRQSSAGMLEVDMAGRQSPAGKLAARPQQGGHEEVHLTTIAQPCNAAVFTM